MANAFDFGIGISASDDGATEVIRGVIGELSNLSNSLDSMALGGGIREIMGGWDPTALLPAQEIFEQMQQTLHDIGGVVVEISGDTEKMAKAFGKAAPNVEAAVDDADALGKEICGVVVCAENADQAIKAASASTGQWGQNMSEVPRKAMSVADHFGRVGEAANLLEGSGSRLRQEMTRTYRRMGDTAEAADLMGASVLRTAKDTKVAWQEVSGLNTRLAGAAISMDDLSGSAEQNMRTMVMMTESFGLTKDQVRDLAGTMKMTGNSITDLAGTAVQFEKDFRVPGIINTLPDAAEAAVAAQAQFGSVVNKSSKDITTNIVRMTGTYARALGVTAAEAANKARTTFMKFTGEIESFEDIFLGLADDFTPLQTAFLETGMSMEDMEDLMRKGAESPAEFAEEVKRIRDSMDPQMGERFFRQVLRNTDEATKRLLTQENAAKEANEATAGAGAEPEDPSKTFNAIADAMRENALDAAKMKEALVGVREETTKMAADEGIRQGLEAYNSLLQAENELLISTYENLRKNEEAYKSVNSVIGGTTLAMTGLNDVLKQFNQITGVGATLLLGAVSALMIVPKALSSVWKGLKTTGGWFQKLFRWLRGTRGATAGAGGAVKGFSKVLGKIALPVAIAIAAFEGIIEAVQGVGKVLSDPSKTGWDKFKGVVMAVLKGVWVAIDSFLLGIPQIFVDGWNNVGKATETEGTRSLGEAVGKIIGTVAKTLIEFFGTTVPNFMRDDAIPAISQAWKDFNFVDDLLFPALSGLAALGDHILAFFGGVFRGIGEAFGVDMDAMSERLNNWWTFAKFLLTEAATFWGDWFTDIGDWFTEKVLHPGKMAFLQLQEYINPIVTEIGFWFEKMALGLKAVFLAVLGAVATPFTWLVDNVVLGSIKNVLDGVNLAIGSINSMIESLPKSVRDSLGISSFGYMDASGLEAVRENVRNTGGNLTQQGAEALNEAEALDDNELKRRKEAAAADTAAQSAALVRDMLQHQQDRAATEAARRERAATPYMERMERAFGEAPPVPPLPPGGTATPSEVDAAARSAGGAAAVGGAAGAAAASPSTPRMMQPMFVLQPGVNGVIGNLFDFMSLQISDNGQGGGQP